MTKKIAVVAANGRAGSLIVEEAVRRGFDVTAIVRGENRTAAQNSVIKDALELTTEDLEGFDAVVDAVGGWTPETIPGITDAGIHLANVLVGTDVRLLIVGGAGSLFVNPEHTVTVDMGPDFPMTGSRCPPRPAKSLLTFAKRTASNGPSFPLLLTSGRRRAHR